MKDAQRGIVKTHPSELEYNGQVTGHTDVPVQRSINYCRTHKVMQRTSERLKMLDHTSGATNPGFWDF
ncbi:hypothetical protein [Zhongshania sp. BJYM1]|jgi:hypothetical protein|uniref:hypothetical protein n=1 Tax=Zhongshania aquatica TaxID=2965069 RepID=UPI0022B35A6F|nr:hypothetical protein [Marortus sp. BJYM1]